LTFGGWIVVLGGVAVTALLAVGNFVQTGAKEADPGLTTETAALLMYCVGAYLVIGHAAVAIALGGATALLLPGKHRYTPSWPASARAISRRSCSSCSSRW
jgi:uncharacterized membrane protein (DUF4010 family)